MLFKNVNGLEDIEENPFFLRPSWIFGGHFDFLGGPGVFSIKYFISYVYMPILVLLSTFEVFL